MNLPPGSRIGRFQVVGLLGEGAMGVVYLGHDPQIERPVAIKTVRPQGVGGSSAELESRFLNEAKLAGRLQHPNIVTIYEAGQAEGLLYIAMEYVDGDALTHFLAPRDRGGVALSQGSTSPRGMLSLAERVEVVREAALALQHAHQRGVLHRDVKPGNILLTRDRRVKVADFGIGKLLAATVDLTRTGQMIGSPAYMSPEQIRGEKLDGRSDFFSLGVVFYELMTGSRPFPGDSITTLVYQILHTEPRDPLAVRSDLPPAARDVFARLLAKSPDKRPSDAADFLREVGRVADQIAESEKTIAMPLAAMMAPAAPPPPPPRPPAPVSTAPVAPVPPARVATTVVSPGSTDRAESDAVADSGGPPPGDRAAATSGPSGRSAGALYLFGIAALLIALGFFVWSWRRSNSVRVAQAGEPTAAPGAGAVFGGAGALPAPTPSLAIPAAAEPTLAPPPTIGPLPTRGPATAADAVVGAPRYTGLAPTRAPRSTPTQARIAAAPPPEPPAEPRGSADSESLSSGGAVDNTYRTRRFAKFGVSPDQARMYVDGRYVGIADDWDDRGGGRKLEFTRSGRHRVRFELPGYRDLNVAIFVSPDAGDDTADVGDELKRESRQPFAKLPSLSDRTVGPVVFKVDPPDATITEGGRTLGTASSFGPDSPLRLHGPMVHDLQISAPGRKSKTVRILVAGNAENDKAEVKVELKKE